MGRVHDAMRRAEHKTGESGVRKTPQAIADETGVPPNSAAAGQLDPLTQQAVKPEEEYSDSVNPLYGEGLLAERRRGFRRFGGDPVHRNGTRRPGNLSELAQEQIVKLVQRVFMFPNSDAPRCVVLTSVEKGCGSSEICFHAGAVLASQISQSVCLVDANLYTPSLHHLLGVDKFPGFADAMVNPDPIKDFALSIGENLWLLPCGSPPIEASKLLPSDRLAARIIELKEEFDYVLIDAPPSSSSEDAIRLGQIADGVILIVEASSTRREKARKVKETLQTAKVNILGAILNNRTFPIPEALYNRL